MRVGFENRHSVTETADVLVVAIGQQAKSALVIMDLMFMLKLQLISIKFEQAEINRQLVWQLWRGDAAKAHGPIIPIEFCDATPGIATRVRGKIIGGIGHEGQIQETLARIDSKSALVEKIEDAEISRNEDQPSAGIRGPQLLLARFFYHRFPSQSEGLPEIGA